MVVLQMIERPMYADKIILQMILPAATTRGSKQCTLRIFFYRVSAGACGKHLTTHHRKKYKSTPHKDHILDFARVLLAYF